MDDAIQGNWARQLAEPAMPAGGDRGTDSDREDSDRDSHDEAGGGAEEGKLADADSPPVGAGMEAALGHGLRVLQARLFVQAALGAQARVRAAEAGSAPASPAGSSSPDVPPSPPTYRQPPRTQPMSWCMSPTTGFSEEVRGDRGRTPPTPRLAFASPTPRPPLPAPPRRRSRRLPLPGPSAPRPSPPWWRHRNELRTSW